MLVAAAVKLISFLFKSSDNIANRKTIKEILRGPASYGLDYTLGYRMTCVCPQREIGDAKHTANYVQSWKMKTGLLVALKSGEVERSAPVTSEVAGLYPGWTCFSCDQEDNFL
jgi:hypothetical protein